MDHGHAWAKRQRHKSLSTLEVRARRAPRVMVKLYSIPLPCQIREESPCLLHFEESLGVFGLIYLRNFLNSECAVGCFRKTLFQENQKYNPPSISLGARLKESKRFFDFDKV